MFLLYHPTTRPTGRKLANALNMRCGRIGGPVRLADTVLRWGNSRPLACEREINTANAVHNAADKLSAFHIMQNTGVRVPDFRFATPFTGYEGKVLGRSRHGSGGRGIVVYHNGTEALPGHEMYVKYIPNSREYRLHVVGDNVIRVQRKYLENRDTESDIKNHANGYVFKAPQRQLNRTRLNMAVKAVKSLGLDFGAVDMVIDAEGKEWVLEVNTAPACSPRTLAAYTEALQELLDAA